MIDAEPRTSHDEEMPSNSPAAITIDRALVTALRAHLQAQNAQPVSLIETHISWVLLTDSVAYKLKKPVSLSFVDFSTLAARKHFCEEEVRLNRRLAPSLYLGVVSVCGTIEAPHLGGDDAIDFAVCMRRFPEDALLRNLLRAGRLETERLASFAQRLAAFHAQAQAAPPSSRFGSAGQITSVVKAALSGLSVECGAESLEALRGWVAAQSELLLPLWPERQRAGAIRECHGDLHLANVVQIDGELIAFDCVEFEPALRWIDVMSDVAFLTMDLKAHRRADLAFRFLDAWLEHSGDHAGLPVLRFNEVYRALVRALVGRLRARGGGEASDTDDPDYLRCAEELASARIGQARRLMITHGLSGSGKSTVASELLAVAGAIRIRSDVERKRLFGLSPLQRSADHAANIYTPEATRRTFDRLAECARVALQAGYPVIVDAAFLRRDERMAFRSLAAELGVPFSILWCRADEAQLRERVVARDAGGKDASEADLAVLERQIATHEPLDAEERTVALEIATDAAVDAVALNARWLAGP